MRTVHLKAERLHNDRDAARYMHEVLGLPAHSSRDTASLEKDLANYNADVMFLLDSDCVHEICEDEHAFQLLMLLGRCAEKNGHIRICFDTGNGEEV